MDRAVQPGGDRRDDGGVVLLLSLKLILLAFFILLVALSRYQDHRTRAVLESVNRAFDGRILMPESEPRMPAALATLPDAASLAREFGNLFEAIVPSSEPVPSGPESVVHVRLAETLLFRPGEETPRRSRRILFKRLAKALRHREAGGLDYDLQILYGVEAAARVAADALEPRRLRALAERLVEHGLPPEVLAIGLRPGRPGEIEFVVHVRNRPAVPHRAALGTTGQ
ncbi:MAG TPA: hypothetical protein VLL72_10535 [Kiloniellales bacterium]|nr:hypothetical protein [Kiloniellales bacterium]